MALISKGIELWIKEAGNLTNAVTPVNQEAYDETYGALLYGLQEVGELSGIGAGTTRDKIEVTTLADDKHEYVEGIISESDNSAISFKFLFDAQLFAGLKQVVTDETTARAKGEDTSTYFVKIPVGAGHHIFSFQGYISGLKMDSASVNSALTMSLDLTPSEAISFTAGK